MNSSGYNLANLHNGDTFIENGSLYVDGQIIAEGATGQTEYLDSGTYDPVFSNFININSVAVQTGNNLQTIFTKNGNIITLDTNLDVNYPALNNPGITILRFNMTVPSSLDIFDVKMLTNAPCVTGSTEFGIVLTTSFYVSEGVVTIQLQANNINIASTNSSLSLKLVYKLEGDDVPATAIVTSGGGSGGNVRNPMEENLDGGGFNITNVQNITSQGTISANSIIAPNVITNPLNNDLYVDGKLIKNNVADTAYIQVTPSSLIINGNTAFNNDIVMTGEIVGSNSTTGLVLETTAGGNENIYARGGGEFVIESTSGLSMAGKQISGVSIIKSNTSDITITPLIGVNPANLILQGNYTNIQSNFGLNMTGKFITECATIKSNNNDLTINASTSGDTLPANIILSGNRVDVSCSNGIDMLNHDITNCALLYSKNLNNAKLIRIESDFITPALSGIYIIYGKITMTNPYFLIGDTVLIGAGGRDTCSLDWNIADPPPPNYCLTNTDFNLDIINLNMSNISASLDLMRCSNPSKNKIMTVTNSSFRDCQNSEVIYIDGFDLVDFNQVLFQYNQVQNKHFYIDSGSKLQISSCEFLRQANRTLTSFGTAPMIEIDQTTTNWGAINISSNLIHPQQTQDAIKLKTITPLEAVISSNTFISLGLTTGLLINYTAGDINNYPALIVSDNSGVKNEKALLSASSQNNTTYTATVLNTFVPVDFGANFVVGKDDRFSPTLNPFEFRYDANQPISSLISVSVSADHGTNSNDTIIFALEQNSVIVSEYQVEISANDIKSFTYTVVSTLQKNDVLRFVVKNITAGTDINGFRAVSFVSTLVEI